MRTRLFFPIACLFLALLSLNCASLSSKPDATQVAQDVVCGLSTATANAIEIQNTIADCKKVFTDFASVNKCVNDVAQSKFAAELVACFIGYTTALSLIRAPDTVK